MAIPANKKKSAPKKATPRKRQPHKDGGIELNEDTKRIIGEQAGQIEELLRSNANLRIRLTDLMETVTRTQTGQVMKEAEEKPCAKCQILNILEEADLSESQINSIMRDVNNEIQESRMRRRNRLHDETRLSADKLKSFEADCESHEPYNC